MWVMVGCQMTSRQCGGCSHKFCACSMCLRVFRQCLCGSERCRSTSTEDRTCAIRTLCERMRWSTGTGKGQSGK
jgi:hypothetical protein